MVITLRWILVFLAFVCFILQTFGVQARVNLNGLGLAFVTLAYLIP